jgi:hypothetical protein
LLLSTPTGEVEAIGVVRWMRAAVAMASAGLGIALEALPFEARERVDAFCGLRAPIDPAVAAHGGRPVRTKEARGF